jgi:tetratricopeptide (TPR) repeat protein
MTVPPSALPADCEGPHGGQGYTVRMEGTSHDGSTFNQVAGDQNIILELPPLLPPVACTLPADTAAFTGRTEQLEQISAAAVAAANAGRVVAIHAIDGMPGVGKTTLAVHVGHMVAAQFPDRQLFVDLHAHTPGQPPAEPGDALAVLLAADGVDPRYLPDDLDGRAAMWRSRMAGKKVLLILDNVADSEQAAPLLPGAAGCLVLVTSRRYLGDLPAALISVPLDTLPIGDAAEMFIKLAPRAMPELGKVTEMVALCGCLPLAISLLASLFTRHQSWTMDQLISETKAELLTVRAENRTVAAAFELSYQYLPEQQQRFFRDLGLHPGEDIDPYAAAAITGLPLEETGALLDELHGDRLLVEPIKSRYQMHNLIHEYARSLAAATSPAMDHQLGRLFDYYQHTAATAEAHLGRQTRAVSVVTAPPAAAPQLDEYTRALAWARTERANLLACLDYVALKGQFDRVVALSAVVASLLRLDGPWTDAVIRYTTAVQAAQSIGDQIGEADALNNLAIVRMLTGDLRGAARALAEAVDISREIGDQQGRANALNNLGSVRRMTGDYPGAVGALEEGLSICREIGDRLGEAGALTFLGGVRYLTGDYPGAVRALEEALAIYRDLGYRMGQAGVLNNLGIVRRVTGNYPGAVGALEEALEIYGDLGDRLNQAGALNGLGIVRRVTGDYPGAATALEEALSMFRDVGSPLGHASALNALGIVRRLTGDFTGAARALEQALGIFRDLGDRQAESEVLNELGTLSRVRGDLESAGNRHRQALELAQEVGSFPDEARALAGLGRCALALGRTAAAKARMRQALKIFQRLAAAEAADLAIELETLTRAGPAKSEGPELSR